MRNRLTNLLDQKFKQEKKVTENKLRIIISNFIDDEITRLDKKSNYGLPKNITSIITRRYGKLLNDAIKKVFEELPISKRSHNRLRKLGVTALLKEELSYYTGLVIAGFGKKEIFPHVTRIGIHSIVANRIKYFENPEACISDDNGACVIPLAQRAMVDTFIQGIDPTMKKFVFDSLLELFEEYPKMLAKDFIKSGKTQKSLINHLVKISLKAKEDFVNDWNAYQYEHHIGPILQTVAMLPKDELASMAESLVNLTVLKKRTSTDAETVGGPIDVAVITKGDGFVWIKRKHYFDAELNPRYTTNIKSGGLRWESKKRSNQPKKS